MSDRIKVLCIDGGGIRGIIPARILAEIEDRTSKPIAELFDLIAGTSTGGILALGLTKPDGKGKPEHSAEKLVELYEKEGRTIFPQAFYRKGWIGPKYPVSGVEKVLSNYFGKALLRDALTDVLVVAYDIQVRAPHIFKSRDEKKKKKEQFLMTEVARATSAAPTYFKPFKPKTRDVATLIDGGVFANNPTLCGYVEAKTYHPQAKDFLVVSLGTGDVNKSLPYNSVKGWGLVEWARPILDVVFDGVSANVHDLMNLLLPFQDNAPTYYRFQVKLDAGKEFMDNASKNNIESLKVYAKQMLNDRKRDLEALCKQLVAP